MGSNNRLASPQGMSAPPRGGYSQTLNINDAQGPAPTPPWGGSAPQISSPTPMPSMEMAGGQKPPPTMVGNQRPAPQVSSSTPMPASQASTNFNGLQYIPSGPMYGGGPMGMFGGGSTPMGNSGFMPMGNSGFMPMGNSGFMGPPQQRCPTCGK